MRNADRLLTNHSRTDDEGALTYDLIAIIRHGSANDVGVLPLQFGSLAAGGGGTYRWQR